MKKNIFTIPNLLTLINLLCGFMSIYNVIEGDYHVAALLIMYGMIFDFLDGYAARLLNIKSDLGKQLDSFADLVTFGLAPVIIILAVYYRFKGFIYDFSLIIYFCAIIYRLAKYNMEGSRDFFKGLPSTFSGGFIAFIFLWFPILFSKPYSFLLFIILAFMSLLEIPYNKIVIKSHYHIFLVLLLIICYGIFKEYLILILFIFYLLSGFINYLFYRKKFGSIYNSNSITN
ncbi:MAG: CDP-alcohol phosphatidyltransferase family protein [Candidatus Omnitrophica bacterium]|nr:CDP-alcohol phosphatidyltransferase family protein [Candidatus Omnitrophota bacterium]